MHVPGPNLLERTINQISWVLDYVDQHLTWKLHSRPILNESSMIIAKYIGILKRIDNLLPQITELKLCFALRHPNINYFNITWQSM